MTQENNKNNLDPELRVEAFVQLLQANRNRIYTYILSLIPNRNDSDDIMQDTTTVLWRKFDEYTLGTDFVAWSLTIAHYQVLSFRKKKAMGKLVFTDSVIEIIEQDIGRRSDEDPENQIDKLKQCMKNLSERDRRLLSMRYEENHSTRMISERIGRTVRAVNKALARVHLILQRCVRRQQYREGSTC